MSVAPNITLKTSIKIEETTAYTSGSLVDTYDNDGLLISSGDYTLTRDTQNAYTTSLTDGNLTQTRTYNNFGEITEVSDNTFSYQLTSRDSAGAIVQKTETINSTTETYDYTYDTMGRLMQACRVGLPSHQGCETYSYDNNGNRASATVNGTTISASYTLDDNLVVYGDNSYGYDEDGYLKTKTTPDGATSYDYGTLGELREVVTPTKTISYKHNANNQRVAKLINGTVVEKYFWANLTTLLAVYDKDDNLVQRFEYADQRMPVAMTMGATKYYLHYDQVGSLRAVSDTSHNIIKEIVYDTFGNILADTNPSFRVPFGFAGGLYDSDTKLTRFGYRDYDATTGKWTAKDPIGFSGGDSNLYGYVLGDPVRFVDPRGEFVPLVALGAFVGGIVGGGYYALTTNNFSWSGFAGSVAGGAIAGGIGVIATPLASSIGWGTGWIGTGAVNAGAGLLAATATAGIDPCQNLTLGYALSSVAFGAAGGALAGRIFPTIGMTSFGQVGFPRTWRGVIPGTMGINARNSIWLGGASSVGVGSAGSTHIQPRF